MTFNPEKHSPKFKYSDVSEIEVSPTQLKKIKYEAELLRKDVSYIIKCYPYLLEENITSANTKVEETPKLEEKEEEIEEEQTIWDSGNFWGYF